MSVSYIYAIDSAGDLTSASTGSTSGNTMNTDELLWVTSGSTVSGAILQISSVSLTGSGSAVTNPGNGHWVYNGGSITGQGVTQPLSGGAALVDSGATLTQATAELGGGIMVLSGGVTNGSILSGGFETILSGGTASATVSEGGNENVYQGGTATSTTINSGGGQEVYSGGVANTTIVTGFGTQDVWAGGTTNSATLDSGSVQTIHSGGGSFASWNTGGKAQIYGFELSGTVLDTGVMDVMSGGNAQSTFLTSGGTQIISAGGVGTGVNVEILGNQTVLSGGTAYNSFLTGGVLVVQSGGIASIPVVSSGEIVVSAGGAVDGASGLGGTIEVMSGGSVHASVLSGTQQILQGGTANGTQIMSGGSEVVVSGSSISPVIYAGGSETVYSGATIKNVEISGAGTLSLQSGANVVGDILFGPAGGRLQLIGATLPSIKIDGLAVGDSIDLNNIASGTAATYTVSSLTVTGSSGALATLSLGTAPDGMLTVTSDGHGGTLVSVTAFTAAQAVSSYQSSGLPGGALISDSAANVAANIDALGAIANAGKIVGITLTDTGTPTISVTAAQYANDAKALADIGGASGHATVVTFTGASTQYTVTAGSGVVTVGSEAISGVTALHFSDFTEIVATASHPGATLSSLNVAELYSAALNRAPDVAGLAYYENAISANPTLSGVTLGEFFLSSAEYTTAHSYAQTAAGDTQFINDLYTNVLHRTGSSAEVAYYQGVINGFLTGQTTGTAGYTAAELQAHAQVLQYFSASAEFLSDIQITAKTPASASHWLLVI